MGVPVVLTDQSAGAPDLSGSDGALYDVLKWALPQLGWTLEFDDTVNFRAAFRNDPVAGSGGYFRVSDKATDHAATERRAAVSIYSSMTDVNTGTDQVPSSEIYWLKSEAETSAARAFRIIGDETFFWFFSACDSPSGTNWFHFAGDYAPFLAADTNTFIVSGSSSQATGTTYTSPFRYIQMTGMGSSDIHPIKNYDGAATSRTLFAQGPNAELLANSGIGGNGPMLDRVLNNVVVAKVNLVEHLGTSGAYAVRGTLRGLLNPQGNFNPLMQSTYVDGDFVPDVYNGSSIISALFVEGTAAEATGFSSYLHGMLFDTSSDWGNW